MPTARQPLGDAALIVGCGYLGRRLARRLVRRGQPVYGTTRSREKFGELTAIGVRPLLLSVTSRPTFASLRPVATHTHLDVYYLVPPGRPTDDLPPRRVLLEGIDNLLSVLDVEGVRRAVLSSSTAVYGQRNGQRVDAQTDPRPTNAHAKLLVEGEARWLSAGRKFHVLRLAGLYGPGRIIGLAALREGAPIAGNGNVLMNLIHVNDAADLLIALMRSASANHVELGCDGSPVPRVVYYRTLAERMGAKPPAVLDAAAAARIRQIDRERLDRVPNKACSNLPTCRRTGWSPRYRDYRHGLNAVMQHVI